MNFEQKMFRGTEKKYTAYSRLPISFLKLSAAFLAFYIHLFHMLTAVVPICMTYNRALKNNYRFRRFQKKNRVVFQKIRALTVIAFCRKTINFLQNEWI